MLGLESLLNVGIRDVNAEGKVSMSIKRKMLYSSKVLIASK